MLLPAYDLILHHLPRKRNTRALFSFQSAVSVSSYLFGPPPSCSTGTLSDCGARRARSSRMARPLAAKTRSTAARIATVASVDAHSGCSIWPSATRSDDDRSAWLSVVGSILLAHDVIFFLTSDLFFRSALTCCACLANTNYDPINSRVVLKHVPGYFLLPR
jgi:hypothetical protein